MTKVLIQPCEYDTMRQAVDLVFETFPIDLKGKSVFIKPNVLRSSLPQEGITTHPKTLKAVLDKVKALGSGKIVVGDNPGLFNYGANEESFRISGLAEAAGEFYTNIGNESRKVAFNPKYMDSVSVSKAVLECDVFISIPRFKTHGLTVITGAIKNSYGILPGAQKAKLHKAAGNPFNFHEVIVEVFKLRPPDLFIMDAVTAMEGNGPASPDLRHLGLLLAADNAVAMDSVVAYMMGIDAEKLRFLQKAKEDGLGDFDLGSINIIGELFRIPDYKLPPLGGEAIIGNEGFQNFIQARIDLRPKADPDLCTQCGTCIDHCAVQALRMLDDLPQVDADTCITCFCCQEMCPEKAIQLQ